MEIRRPDADRKTNVGTDFQHFAARDSDRAGLCPSWLCHIARACAVNRRAARVTSFAMIRRHGGGLAKRLPARLLFRLCAQNHVATGNIVGMKPPVVRPGRFDTQKIVVGVRSADKQRPRSGKLVRNDARLCASQYLPVFALAGEIIFRKAS